MLRASPCSNLELAVTHLNASVGPILSIAQLAKALREGSIGATADSPTAAALVGYLFIEIDPRLISLCAREAGSDVSHANMLYQETLRHHLPRVAAWEKAMEYLL